MDTSHCQNDSASDPLASESSRKHVHNAVDKRGQPCLGMKRNNVKKNCSKTAVVPFLFGPLYTIAEPCDLQHACHIVVLFGVAQKILNFSMHKEKYRFFKEKIWRFRNCALKS